ncbi:MAG: type IV pilus secretin PilQ [Bacteriovoracaceae bacterium]|nr:type IV pilus secretin PilQ [Bacteriovoracaceae bacterium]
MKKGFFLILLMFSLLPRAVTASKIEEISFQQKGEVSQIVITTDDDAIKAKKFHVTEDKQIIVDLKNVEATARVMRAFDTSEFSGSTVFIRAYKKPGSKNDIRIAVQLRDNVRSIFKRVGSSFVLSIENRFGVFSEQTIQQFLDDEKSTDNQSTGKVHVPRSKAVEDILENLTLSGKKKYIGRRISVNVKNMKIEDLLMIIADSSGFNIIMTKEVKTLPPLTLSMVNVPWDQVLDTILKINKLVAKKNGIILMIQSLRQSTEEKKQEIAANKLNAVEEPMVTKVFPLSFAKLSDIKKIVTPYLTKNKGTVALDKRTKQVIVKDTVESIERIRKIIEVLDVQTPQVLIEAKIVEVTESYAKEIGLGQGLNLGFDPVGEIGADEGPGIAFSSAPSAERDLFGINIKQMGRLWGLGFNLKLMESESKGKIIANPKVIAQNNVAATISTQDTTSFSVTKREADGSTSTTFEQVSADLSLNVTPQVTNEGSIFLKVAVSKTHFGTRPTQEAPPNTASRSVKTEVLVDNGSTVVIGGIYAYSKSEQHSGVPYLKDIPLIGWLFRTAYAPKTDKNEMIIFLTPRIVNQEEAGLISEEFQDEA